MAQPMNAFTQQPTMGNAMSPQEAMAMIDARQAAMAQPTAPQAAPQMTLADVLAMQGQAMASPTPLVGAMAAPTGGLFDPLNQMVVGRQAMEMENQRAQQAQDAQNALLMYKDQQAQQAAAAEKAKYDNTVATLEAYFTQNPDKTGGLPPRQAAELKASGKMPSVSSSVGSDVVNALGAVESKKLREGYQKQVDTEGNLRRTGTRLLDVLIDEKGNPRYELTGGVATAKRLLSGAAGQLQGIRKDLVKDAAINSMDLSVGKWFDPNLGEADLFKNMLAYQVARANDPSGRVSDADLRAAMNSLGGDEMIFGNTATLANNVESLMEMSVERENALRQQIDPNTKNFSTYKRRFDPRANKLVGGSSSVDVRSEADKILRGGN